MYYILALVFILDQLLKILIMRLLIEGQSIPVISSVFHITYVNNTGIAFGIFKGAQFIIISLSVIMILFIIIFRKSLSKEHRFVSIFLGLILGGALGNLVDRLRFGHVVDYLDFRVWPVFNLADMCICIGVIGFSLCTLFFFKKA